MGTSLNKILSASELPNSTRLIRNPLSLIGLALAAVAFVNIVFLFAIDVLSSHPSPYVGILAYMIAPGFLVVGLILVPTGIHLVRTASATASGRVCRTSPQ